MRRDCYATIGQVGNLDTRNLGAGKAGQKSLEGTPSQGQGSVMNPVDHPTVVVKVEADGGDLVR